MQTMHRIFYFTNIQLLYIFLDNIWKICTYHTPYGNVTYAGWQVTLCHPMWHVSSCSSVATLRTAINLLLTYLPLTITKLRTLKTVLFGPPCIYFTVAGVWTNGSMLMLLCLQFAEEVSYSY